VSGDARRLVLHAAGAAARVDRYVAEHTQLSRSAMTRLAREGHVSIGGRVVEAGHRVRQGDEIVVEIPAEAPRPSLEAEDIPIDVVFEQGKCISCGLCVEITRQAGVRPGLMKTASITGISRRSIRLSSTLGARRSPSMFLKACPSLKIISRAGVRVNCEQCGEEIINERELILNGRVLCRACGWGGYYSPAPEFVTTCLPYPQIME